MNRNITVSESPMPAQMSYVSIVCVVTYCFLAELLFHGLAMRGDESVVVPICFVDDTALMAEDPILDPLSVSRSVGHVRYQSGMHHAGGER